MAVRRVTRANAASVAELSKYGVATIHEAMGRVGLLAAYMRPIYPGAHAVGSALTVLVHPGDNTMLHVAASLCEAGDIIVVSLSAENSDAMLLIAPLDKRIREHGHCTVAMPSTY